MRTQPCLAKTPLAFLMADLTQAVEASGKMPIMTRRTQGSAQSETSRLARESVHEWLSQAGQATAAEAAKNLNLNKSTVHSYLRTLIDEGRVIMRIAGSQRVFKVAE